MRDVERAFIKWRVEVDDFVQANDQIDAKIIFDEEEFAISSQKIQNYIKAESDFRLPLLAIDNFNLPPEPLTSIQFAVEKSKVQRIKENLKKPKITNKSLGEYIFNYFYEREIDEDE